MAEDHEIHQCSRPNFILAGNILRNCKEGRDEGYLARSLDDEDERKQASLLARIAALEKALEEAKECIEWNIDPGKETYKHAMSVIDNALKGGASEPRN